jgi:hypothetical protein
VKSILVRKTLLFAAITLCCALTARAAEVSATQVVQKLDALRTNIAAELTLRLSTNAVPGSYTTVWRQFEDMVVVGLREILPRHIPELTAKHFDAGESGREKNRLADFAITCGTNTIEISIKSARNTGQPENDLGTFRDYENRQRQFAASPCLCGMRTTGKRCRRSGCFLIGAGGSSANPRWWMA